MSAITLFKEFAYGMLDYITRHNSNYALIESTINLILGQLTGQSGGLAVPLGLQEIFDRRGLIGASSYDFTAAGGVLTVQPGAYWNAGTFYHKTAVSTLTLVGKGAGTYYINLDAAGNPLVSAAADATTTRQLSWNGTDTVSAKALYAGVAILFDGDDYAACLSSTARAKTFAQLATRLEEIEVLLSKTVQTPASADTVNINWALGGIARVVLNRAITTFVFSGAYDGQKLVLELVQDPEGGREIDFETETIPGTDFTFPVPLSEANHRDFLGFIYSAGNTKYNYVSLARGY